MRKLLVSTLLLLMALSLTATPVSQAKAVQAAAAWFGQNNRSASPAADCRIVYHGSTPTIYIVNMQPAGFVLVSADDNALPILGYSYEQAFPAGEMRSNYGWLINQLGDEVYYASTLPVIPESISRWDNLLNNVSQQRETRDLEPMMQIHWNQDYPYNSMCPADAAGPGGHVYAGCVATAMGQIMRYWCYPPQGSGTHTYTHPEYGQQTANFGTTTYDWWNMPRRATENNLQIARLLYQCGVAVDMNYAADGSGAQSDDVPYAMQHYFLYDSTLRLLRKSGYSDTNWATTLRNELDTGRVIYYSGNDAESGHAFVCDGYQDTNYFHYNFGWSGSSDGYFIVNAIYGEGGAGFNSNQVAIIGIQPPGWIPNYGTLVYEGVAGDNDYSGQAISQWLQNSGTEVNYTNDFPCTLSGFDRVYLSFGNYPAASTNHTEFTESMADVLADYIKEGGEVYLEGGQVTYASEGLNPLMGLSASTSGNTNVINGLQGLPFNAAYGLQATSSSQTQNDYITILNPGEAQPALYESDYGIVGTQYTGSYGQKVFVSTYSLGCLGSTFLSSFLTNLNAYYNSTETINTPDGLQGTMTDGHAVLTWNAAAGNGQGYRVWRNGVAIAMITDFAHTTYTDTNPVAGLNTYSVTAGYLVGESVPSNSVTLFYSGNTYHTFGPADTSAEEALTIATGKQVAVRINPGADSRIDYLLVYLQQLGGANLMVRVFSDNSGLPSTQIVQKVVSNAELTLGWNYVDLGDSYIMGSDADYYVTVAGLPNGPRPGMDTANSGSSYTNASGSWQPLEGGNLMAYMLVRSTTATNDNNNTAAVRVSALAYPNPFNPVTTIRYNLPQNGPVHLSVFNARGQKVQTLVRENQERGEHTVVFNGQGLGSGVYFYRLAANGQNATGKMIMLK